MLDPHAPNTLPSPHKKVHHVPSNVQCTQQRTLALRTEASEMEMEDYTGVEIVQDYKLCYTVQTSAHRVSTGQVQGEYRVSTG